MRHPGATGSGVRRAASRPLILGFSLVLTSPVLDAQQLDARFPWFTRFDPRVTVWCCTPATGGDACGVRSAVMKQRTPFFAAAGFSLALAGGSPAGAAPAAAPTPSAETTFYLAPLDAAGYVDYARAVNRELKAPGLTPEQNVFVGLLEQADNEHWDPGHLAALAEALDDFFVPVPAVPFVAFDRFAAAWGVEPAAAAADRDRAGDVPFDAASAPVTAAWLDAVGPALDGMTRALRRPHYYAPLVRAAPDDPLVHALLPHLEVLRGAGVALRTRGSRRLAAGDVGGATDDLIALRRLAAWASHGPAVIDELVAISIGRLADDLLAALFSHRGFGRAHYDAVRRAKPPAPTPMGTAVGRFARVLMLDTAIRAARDPGSLARARATMTQPEADAEMWAAVARVMSDPRFDLTGLLNQISFLYDEMPSRGRDETLDAFAKRVDRYRTILERRGPGPAELGKLKAYTGETMSKDAYGLAEAGVFKIMTSLPIAGDVAPLLTAETAQDCRVVRALAMTVQDFGLGRGHYPASLDELTPGYIPTLPRDPGDGAAMRYRPDADGQGFTLYSVGPDGEDDGGADDPVDGDLVFRVRR